MVLWGTLHKIKCSKQNNNTELNIIATYVKNLFNLCFHPFVLILYIVKPLPKLKHAKEIITISKPVSTGDTEMGFRGRWKNVICYVTANHAFVLKDI